MISLSTLGCPGTHSGDQVNLKVMVPTTSPSRMLGLKSCATTSWKKKILLTIPGNRNQFAFLF